jgi:hypothetical protein
MFKLWPPHLSLSCINHSFSGLSNKNDDMNLCPFYGGFPITWYELYTNNFNFRCLSVNAIGMAAVETYDREVSRSVQCNMLKFSAVTVLCTVDL